MTLKKAMNLNLFQKNGVVIKNYSYLRAILKLTCPKLSKNYNLKPDSIQELNNFFNNK